MGTNLRDLIYNHCGGMRGDKKLKAVIPGGSSTPVLRADEIDVNMDFDSLSKIGSMLGSGAVIVIEEGTCMVWALSKLTKFYKHESCGQCVPCREGTSRLNSIVQRIENGKGRRGDIEKLLELCSTIMSNTVCPLGDASAMPVESFIKKFKSEFVEHIEKKSCPYR
jgi:NADH-quinone oxidoreductase subunit F